MLDLLAAPFMQRALLAALISGVLAPAVGVYVVQRRLSLLGDGLGHVAIAGVGLAFLVGAAPLPVAIVVCVAGAVLIEVLRQSGRASGDVGLAILFYGGLALGVMLAGLAGQGAGNLSQYLFGSLVTVNHTDLVVMLVLAALVLIPAIGLAPQLFAVCADEEYARTLGLPTRWLNILIVVMAALTVTTAMRTVGVLLISALMVVPVATAQNLAPSFRATTVLAMVLGVGVSVGGTLISGTTNTASGPTIVVTAIVVFLLSWPLARLVRRLGGVRSAWPEEESTEQPTAEPHVIAADCNDVHADAAVLHGDHVDFLHAGHRHAPHGDHFDEH